MITIWLTQNPLLIKEVYSHPQVYPYIRDDSCPKKFNAVNIQVNSLYFAVNSDERLIGIIALHQKNYILWDMHVAFMPQGKGKAKESIELFLIWVYENKDMFNIKKITGSIPEDRPHVVDLVQRIGFHYEGMSPKSFQRDGKLLNTLQYGWEF